MRRLAIWPILLLSASCTSEEDGGHPAGDAASGGSGALDAGGSAGQSKGGTGTGGTSGGGSSAGGAAVGGSGGGSSPAAGGTAGSAASGGASSGGAGGSNDAGNPPDGPLHLYVGTGTFGGDTGEIRLYDVDADTLGLTPKGGVPAGGLASFLAVGPSGTTLYATDEAQGRLRAYGLNRDTGALSVLNEVPSSGHATHVAVDPAGAFLLAADYNEGRVEVFSLEGSGRIGAGSDEESPGANSHQIVFSVDGRFAFVPNKGSDTISQFRYAAGELQANSPAAVATANDAGPRHIAFAPDARHAYVIDELANRVEAYDYDAVNGRLTHITDVSSLPNGFSGSSTGAEIAVHPSGKFVYASNRVSGSDGSIGVFAVGADGRLTLVEHESTRGGTPRHFSLAAGGSLLVVANQAARTVVLFRVNADTGALDYASDAAVNGDTYFASVF